MVVERYLMFATVLAAIVCTPIPAETESVGSGLSAILNAELFNHNLRNKGKIIHNTHGNINHNIPHKGKIIDNPHGNINHNIPHKGKIIDNTHRNVDIQNPTQSLPLTNPGRMHAMHQTNFQNNNLLQVNLQQQDVANPVTTPKNTTDKIGTSGKSAVEEPKNVPPETHTNVNELNALNVIQEEALHIPVTIRIMFPKMIQVRNKWYPLKLRFGGPQP